MKKLLATILALITIFSFAACGGGEEPYEPNTPTPNINPNPNPEPNPPPGDDGSEYWGFYETGDGYLIIHEDGSFEVTDFDWLTYDSGVCIFDDGLTLVSDYSENAFFVLDEYGNLYGGEDYGTFFRFDPEGGTVYTEADYQGYWLYSNGYCIEIDGDEWYGYDDTGELFVYGPVEYDEDAAYLMNEDGSSGGGVVSFDMNGYLVESGEALTHYSEFPYGEVVEYEHPMDYLVGEWYYSGQGELLTFYNDGSYLWETDEGVMLGYCTFDGECVEFDEYGFWSRGYLNEEGHIVMEGDAGSYYFKSDEF